MATTDTKQTTTDELIAYLGSLTSEQLAVVDGWVATHVPPRKVWGWEMIASEIDVCRSVAIGYADLAFDPLPVEYLRGRVWAYAGALRSWMRRQNVPYRLRMALREEGKAKNAAKANSVQAKATSAKRRAGPKVADDAGPAA